MLGLTDIHRKQTPQVKKAMSKRVKKWHAENEHPRGMLGKVHSDETKKIISLNSKKYWQDPNFILNSQEYRQSVSDMVSKRIRIKGGISNNNYSRCKRGWIDIGDRSLFFRSAWEANIAAYFEYLKNIGEINEWLYEEDVFWFEKIKRGVRSYLPDFKIFDKDGDIYYVEVKGWMDEKSKTKIKRMAIYYPKIKLYIFDAKKYREIAKSFSWIKGWGILGL